MDTSKQLPQRDTSLIWEDLVNDFLEMACFLSREERTCLLQELAKTDIRTEEIQVLPTFSIEKRQVSVCENGSPQEFWLYYPKEKKIEKISRLSTACK